MVESLFSFHDVSASRRAVSVLKTASRSYGNASIASGSGWGELPNNG